MSADKRLRNAYREWRRLAQTEGEAIRTLNWALVTECQTALQQLQPHIIRHTQEALKEWSRPGVDRAARESDLRAVVAELIEIEMQNNSVLDRVRRNAQIEFSQLEQASRTLRQVQRSYSPGGPAGWNSFS